MALQNFTLPPLPYDYNALQPAISEAIMHLHHDKHHQTYITNLNKALAEYAAASDAGDIPEQIRLQSAINFNGGGHINHSLFWRNLAPPGSDDAQQPATAAPTLSAAIEATYGSHDAFIEAFSKQLNGIQGSGWGWLVREAGPDVAPDAYEDTAGAPGGTLRIVTKKDQDPVVGGEVPILGVDMWEHAYYLDYQNVRASYVDAVWTVINWTEAEARYTGSRDDAFETLLDHIAASGS